MTVNDCKVLELQNIADVRGSLSIVESARHIPFGIERVFWIYDVPDGGARGAHAHRACHQLLIAASGSFSVVLDDGVNRRTVLLDRPNCGLHIPPGIWAEEQGFSSGSICLVLASHPFDEADYIRDYGEFLQYRKHIESIEEKL